MPEPDNVDGLKSVLGKDVLMDARRHMLALVRIIEIILERVYGEKVRH